MPSLFFEPQEKLDYRLLYRPSGDRQWEPLTNSRSSIQLRRKKWLHILRWEVPDQDSLVGVFDFDIEVIKWQRIWRDKSRHDFVLNLSSNILSSPFGIESLIPIWRFGIVTDFRSDLGLFEDAGSTIFYTPPSNGYWLHADTSSSLSAEEIYFGFATLLIDNGYDGFGIWIHGGGTLTNRRDIITRFGSYNTYGVVETARREFSDRNWSVASTFGVLVTFPTPSRNVDGAVGLKFGPLDRFSESITISIGWAIR